MRDIGLGTWVFLIVVAVWYINHELNELAKRRAAKRAAELAQPRGEAEVFKSEAR